jgi:flagellar biosynthesis/type III secretory pathway M-ring protein FliF/YscJ
MKYGKGMMYASVLLMALSAIISIVGIVKTLIKAYFFMKTLMKKLREEAKKRKEAKDKRAARRKAKGDKESDEDKGEEESDSDVEEISEE